MNRCVVLRRSRASFIFCRRPAHAGTCYVDDPSNLQPRTSPIQTGTGQELPDLCGHEVHGTSCVLEVSEDGVGANGATCLTVKGGVTVEMNGHIIDCDDGVAPCGTAIDLPYATSATTLESGSVTGCWSQALASNAPNSVATDFIIDLQGGGNCSGDGDGGIDYFKTVTRAVVRNVDGTCIEGSIHTTVKDSIIHGCGLGVSLAAASGNATALDNVLIYDTGVALKRVDADITKQPSLRDSAVHDSAICTFRRWNDTCGTLSSEVSLLGLNFIDDVIVH